MSKHWHSNPTQIFWTCHALVQGRTITHMDEIGEVKGWRLGAIIHNLRTKYHWPILTEYRGRDRIAHYWLKPDSDPLVLDYPRSAKGVREALSAALGVPGGADG